MHVARHNPQGNVVPTIIGNNVTIGESSHLRCMARSQQSVCWRSSHLQQECHPGQPTGAWHVTAVKLCLLRFGTLVIDLFAELAVMSIVCLQVMGPSSMQQQWRTAPL